MTRIKMTDDRVTHFGTKASNGHDAGLFIKRDGYAAGIRRQLGYLCFLA